LADLVNIDELVAHARIKKLLIISGQFYLIMAPGFRQKRIDSAERVGEILRSAREAKGEKLEEIARQIRVREENLHNLEEGYYDNLPAEVYSKGFLTAYAEYLGLNADKLVRMYSKEAGIKNHLDENKDEKDGKIMKKTKAPLFTPRLIQITTIVIIVVAAVSYLSWQFTNFSKNPDLDLLEPANDISIEESKINFTGSAEKEGDLTINGQSVFINPDGSFREEVSLQEGLNTIAVVVKDRQGRETSLTRQILVELPEPEPNPEEETDTDDDNEDESSAAEVSENDNS